MQRFAATVAGALSSNNSVTWSLSPAAGTVDSHGNYTAPASIAATSTVSVTATSTLDPTKSAAALVTLQPSGSIWTGAQIGNTQTANFSSANGIFTIGANSGGLYGTSDSGAFEYQQMTGDGTMVARLTSVGFLQGGARIGVMLRSGLQPTDLYAFMGMVSNSGTFPVFQTRTTAGASDVESWGPAMGTPQWLKLVRSGGAVTGYFSGDGVNWTQQGAPVTLPGTTLYAGLVVSENYCCGVTTATFDNVLASIQPDFYLTDLPTTWVSAAAGDTSSFAVGIGAVNGFTGSVSINVTGLPTNSTWLSTPDTFSGSGTGLLAVTVPAATAAGSYPVSVNATYG